MQRRGPGAISETDAELKELRSRLLELESENAKIPDLQEAALERDFFRVRVAALEDDLEGARAQARADAGEAAHLRRVLDDMKSSASWRVTAPLRRLKRRPRS